MNFQSSGRGCRENAKLYPDVIPGRIEDANYDVRLHIGESRDSGSPLRVVRNDGRARYCIAAKTTFTTLLTGNGLSAAISVKVRHT
jgi:hypothetical protein